MTIGLPISRYSHSKNQDKLVGKFRLLRLQRLDAIQIAYEKSLAARSKEKRLYSQDTIQTEPSFLLFTQESENEAPLAEHADNLVIKFSKYLI